MTKAQAAAYLLSIFLLGVLFGWGTRVVGAQDNGLFRLRNDTRCPIRLVQLDPAFPPQPPAFALMNPGEVHSVEGARMVGIIAVQAYCPAGDRP